MQVISCGGVAEGELGANCCTAARAWERLTDTSAPLPALESLTKRGAGERPTVLALGL